MTIVISKLNEINCQILARQEVLAFLYEMFGIYEKGYQFSKLFQKGVWDGKARLISPSGRFGAGLVKKVQKICEYNFPEEEIEFRNFESSDHSESEIIKFVDSLNIPKEFSPREYQIDTLIRSIKNNRLIIISPTSSGKSLMIYLLVRWYLHKGIKKGIILVPSVNLVLQIYKDFVNYGWKEAENFVHLIRSTEKDKDVPLYISTWQSVAKQRSDWFRKFNLVVVDEAQNTKSKSLTTILMSMVSTKYRFGFTGTLSNKESELEELRSQALLGVCFQPTTTAEMIENNWSAEINIKCVSFSYSREIRRAVSRMNYEEEIDYIENNPKRMKYLVGLILGLKGNSLVLYKHITHGKAIYEQLKKHEPDRKVYYIAGKIKGKDREIIRKEIESEPNAIIVGSFGTVSTGISINNLENLVFSTTVKGRIRTLQSIGRVLRLGRNNKVTLYDIVDDLKFGNRLNYSIKHYKNRLKHYTSESHIPTYINIDI